jgi:hypothetical protein
MKFEFQAAVGVKNTNIWNVTLCSLEDMYRHFGDTRNLHLNLDD